MARRRGTNASVVGRNASRVVNANSEANLIGDSVPMQRLRMLIAAVAPTRIPVLIEGATGTGKELVAGLLHRSSGRDGTLVAFNVCALGESMFEDSLFGHVKGAYTGAGGETLGFLREANGGTAFFDEISGLPLQLQAKLLRAIETGVIRPIGSTRDARSDFRTVAATNERLDELVAGGRFRADLAHRLSGVVLSVPSLADRVDDIPVLVEHFVRNARPHQPPAVTRAAMQTLQDRAWPGNVRELRQVVESTMAFSRDLVDVDALQMVLMQRSRASESAPHNAKLVERQRLTSLLAGTAWDTTRAAAMLGVHRTTVYRRMRRLGIVVPGAFERTVASAHLAAPLPSRGFAPISGDVHASGENRANVIM
jgi:two-component system nitrogen regulation response regulator NtrX